MIINVFPILPVAGKGGRFLYYVKFKVILKLTVLYIANRWDDGEHMPIYTYLIRTWCTYSVHGSTER